MGFQDFEEFIVALNANQVRYLIAGAHAVAYHAIPRATKDLDVLVEPTRENAERLLTSLRQFFGGADLGYTVDDVIAPEWILQLGVAPVRIDILSVMSGVDDFAAAWHRRVTARFGSVPASYLSLCDLIAAKEAAGRPQDLADLVALRRARGGDEPAR